MTDIRELQQAFDDAELHADTDRLNTLLAIARRSSAASSAAGLPGVVMK